MVIAAGCCADLPFAVIAARTADSLLWGVKPGDPAIYLMEPQHCSLRIRKRLAAGATCVGDRTRRSVATTIEPSAAAPNRYAIHL